ncbi:hypothetical protein BH10PLA1_BH10PLA1_00360 [soil metagenome]
MNGALKWLMTAALVAGGVGCSNSYERERPPVDSLDNRDKGLQSKDVVDASDKMAASILGDSDLNGRPEQIVLVVDHMQDDTVNTGRRFNLDIFLRRVKTALQQKGRGRITLIANREELRGLQSRELEQGAGDEFGQGGTAGKPAPGPAGTQPDYALNGRVSELNGGGTSYFYLEFNLTGLKGADARKIIWSDAYEVKTDK